MNKGADDLLLVLRSQLAKCRIYPSNHNLKVVGPTSRRGDQGSGIQALRLLGVWCLWGGRRGRCRELMGTAPAFGT